MKIVISNDLSNLEASDPKKIWRMAPIISVPVEEREPSIGTIGRGFVFNSNEPLPHSGSEFVAYEEINPQKSD